MSGRPPTKLEIGKKYFVVSRLIDASHISAIPFAEAVYHGIDTIDNDYPGFVRGQCAHMFIIQGVLDPIPVKRTDVYNSLEEMSAERTLTGIFIRRLSPSYAPLLG